MYIYRLLYLRLLSIYAEIFNVFFYLKNLITSVSVFIGIIHVRYLPICLYVVQCFPFLVADHHITGEVEFFQLFVISVKS